MAKKQISAYIVAISAVALFSLLGHPVLALCELCYEAFEVPEFSTKDLHVVMRNGAYVFAVTSSPYQVVALNSTDLSFIDSENLTPNSGVGFDLIPYSTNGVILSHNGQVKKFAVSAGTISLTGQASLCIDANPHPLHKDTEGRIWSSCSNPDWVYSINPNSMGTVSQSPDLLFFSAIHDVIYDADNDRLWVFGVNTIDLYQHTPPSSFTLLDEFDVSSSGYDQFTGINFRNDTYFHSTLGAPQKDIRVLNRTGGVVHYDSTLDMTAENRHAQLCLVTVCDADYLIVRPRSGFLDIYRADNNTKVGSIVCGDCIAGVRGLGIDTTSENLYWSSNGGNKIIVYNTTDITQNLGGGNNGTGGGGG